MKRWAITVALFLCAVSTFAAEAKRYRATGFVVANGVKLHYVDWGGRGEPLLFLAGFGRDANDFDSIAPRFTDKFRVLGLTRRGFGLSEKPKSGYDTATRVEDIRAFLDSQKIRRVHLAGHSLAGDELTLFATRYPDRVLKLVYFDAAFNRYHSMSATLSDPTLPPIAKRLTMEVLGDPRAQQIVVRDLPPPETWRIHVATMKAANEFRADYRAVRAPALAIYATAPNLPQYMKSMMHSSIAQFKREARRGEVLELPDATHYVFRGATEERVVAATRAFLLR